MHKFKSRIVENKFRRKVDRYNYMFLDKKGVKYIGVTKDEIYLENFDLQ